MFNQFYKEELKYVRELGELYAKANPALAPMLAERSSDPDVERLIEGFAFLTARIRERIEDAAPEIVHNLVELLFPHYLRAIPAASIVELTPNPGALRRRQTVEKHTELATKPVRGTACRFRTSAPVDVLPLQILDVKLEEAGSARPIVRVTFDSTVKEGRNEAFQKAGLRFFIHGDPSTTTTFYAWITRHLDGIRLRGTGAGAQEGIRLGREHVRVVGSSPNFPLLPWPEFAPDGYRVLQEYFTLPQKLLFFDVVDLERARERVQTDRFELSFELGPRDEEGEPPKLPTAIGRGFLRLHCVPVVNLFSVAADPIRRKADTAEYLLRAALIDPAHAEIYKVESVAGVEQGRAKPKTYHPFFSFRHTPGAEYFRLRRVHSPLDDGIDTYLSIVSPRDASAEPIEKEDLSIELTCTNRSLPAELAAGDISVPTSSSPTFATFKNIIGVSKPSRPPLGSELHWRLVAHMAINRRSLTERGMMSALLSLYELSGTRDEQSLRATRLRIDSIRSVSASEVRRLVRGAAVRGTCSTVELDESGFAGPGDALVFGSVIDEVLASRTAMNTFNELRLRLAPSGREYRWPPRSGQQQVL
jgi:type VI secretion system protein ImpG